MKQRVAARSQSRSPGRDRSTGGSPTPLVQRALRGGPLEPNVLLELQRLAGNESVGLLIQREPAGTVTAPTARRPARVPARPPKKAPAAPPGPKASWTGEAGPNAGKMTVGKIERIPIEGLAEGRAIVLLPNWLGKQPKQVEVLVHLHGFGVGYRQLTKKLIDKKERTSTMNVGQNRDLAVDRTEAQIEASRRDVVGILPQAAGSKSEFGNFTNDTYIQHVFAALTALKFWDTAPEIRGVIFSGHSGAGNTMTPMLDKDVRLPEKLEEVILFDALNWDGQVGQVNRWLERQLAKDLHNLVALSTKATRLEYLTRSMRFRGYHTHTGNYAPRYQKVDAFLNGWFERHTTMLGILGIQSELRANYSVTDAGAIDHEHVMEQQDRFKESLGALGPVVATPAPPVSAADQQKEAAATKSKLDAALSSLPWVSKTQMHKSTDELVGPFKTHVKAFIALLEANGATVKISATLRPMDRAEHMHWASWIAWKKIKPSEAEDQQKTGIIWDHGDDAKSIQAAKEMCSKAGYDIAFPAALNSNHTRGLAIDMTITGLPETITGLPGKKSARIGTEPAETNTALHDLAWKYYKIRKHPTDPPHWSPNGR